MEINWKSQQYHYIAFDTKMFSGQSQLIGDGRKVYEPK